MFNPDGEECYHASIKSYTGSEKTTEEIFSLGQETVEANRKVVMEKGEPIYGVSEMQEIVDAANSDPENQFSSKEELLEFARNAVERAGREMPNWVVVMPNIPVVVNPLPPEMEGTVTSASYQESDGDRPASYRQPLAGYAELTKGGVERTAFHEAWPGHHLQRATRLSLAGVHPIAELIYIAGYNEGWGRYAEALAEEMGLYRTTSGPILRRAWPGRGMVVDPGIHLYGWTDQQAIDFIVEGGRNTLSSARDVLDRIAILPGQLTSYDTGGLEIMALRTEAENRLGDDFDIREFHHVVLSGGEVPLNQLRLNVENWISH